MIPYRLLIFMLICCFTETAFAQNKDYTDSLIRVLASDTHQSAQAKQRLYEEIIGEFIEYDSLSAEKYLAEWRTQYYNGGHAQKIFYHKNRGILFLNFSNFNKALAQITEGISLASKAGDQLQLADLYNNRANVYADMELDDNALQDYDTAIKIYQHLGKKRDEALTLSNKANLYGTKGNFKQAIPFALQALQIREAIGDEPGAANTSFNLGIMFKNIGRYGEALEYLATPEKYYQKTGNERSLATVNLVKGSTYRSKKMFDLSKSYFLTALPVLEKYNHRGGLVNAYENLGILAAVADSNERQALEYYSKAEQIVASMGNIQGIISTGINVSQSLLMLKEYEQFQAKVDTIEQLARKHHYQQELREILKLKLNAALGKSAETGGTAHFEEFEKLSDSLASKDVQQQISDFKIKYETEKKENTIRLLNSENELQKEILAKNQLALRANALAMERKDLQLHNQQLLLSNQQLDLKNKDILLANNSLELKNNGQKMDILRLSDKNKSLRIQEKNRQIIFGLIAFALLALVAVLFYKRAQLHQKSRLQAAVIREQDSAAKAVISAEENERARMSQNLHDGLGQLLSAAKMNLQAAVDHLPVQEKSGKIYANALQLVDDSITEMRSISHQMVTNNVMRKGLANALKDLIEKIESNKLSVTLEVNGLLEMINPEIQIIVYRILQESIHNIVKHAEASRIRIELTSDKQQLRARIADNGKGFDIALLKSHRGIGLDNIETRVKFLKGSFNITSIPGRGTTIDLAVPLND